jgi:hypothetical protein
MSRERLNAGGRPDRGTYPFPRSYTGNARERDLGWSAVAAVCSEDFQTLSPEAISLNRWIGAKMRELHDQSQLTTTELAARSNTSEPFVMFLRSGSINMQNGKFRLLAESVAAALGTTIEDIVVCKSPNLTTEGKTRSQTADTEGMKIAALDRIRAGVEQQSGESFDEYLERLGLSRRIYFAIKAYLVELIQRVDFDEGSCTTPVGFEGKLGEAFGENEVPDSVEFYVVDGVPCITGASFSTFTRAPLS